MKNWKRVLAAFATAALLVSNLGSSTQTVFATEAAQTETVVTTIDSEPKVKAEAEKAESEEIKSEKTASEKTAPEEVNPEEIKSEEAKSKEAGSEEITSEEIKSEKTASEKTETEEAKTEKTEPEKSAEPEGTQLSETAQAFVDAWNAFKPQIPEGGIASLADDDEAYTAFMEAIAPVDEAYEALTDEDKELEEVQTAVAGYEALYSNSYGAETIVNNDSYTVSVGSTVDISGTRSDYSSSSRWSSSNGSIATVSYYGDSATVTGKSAGTTTIQHTYWKWVQNWDRGDWQQYTETFTVTVTGQSETTKGDTEKVYVYVCAYTDATKKTRLSDECLRLLGIDANTIDQSGYFPAGEIELDKSFFRGKNTDTEGAGLIARGDWTTLLDKLGSMNTETLIDQQNMSYSGLEWQYKKDYSQNRNNHVGEYIGQARQDVGMGWGSQCSALFRWWKNPAKEGHGHYGFEDQTVKYHLDLYFTTNKITFKTGNNGITGGTASDGSTIDSRAYITGSIIMEPENLNIPEGYEFAGYYTDYGFQTEWKGLDTPTPLNSDQTVYIKLVKKLTKLQISKSVVNAPDADKDKEFSFKVDLQTREGSKSYPYTVYNSKGQALPGNNKIASGGTILLKAGQYAVIFELPNGTQYTVTETAEDNYSTPNLTATGTTSYNNNDRRSAVSYTNTYHDPIAITVNKVWDDGDDQDGKRPTSVTAVLLANGAATGDQVVLNEANGWTAQFQNLAAYKNNAQVTYTIDESSVPSGYTKSVNGYTITNTYKPATTSVKVSKAWKDENNQDGLRSNSVVIELLADGKATGNTVTLNANNQWSAEFQNLAVKKSGKAISYTVRENNVKTGYTADITGSASTGYTVTNTHTPSTTTVSGTKTWKDANNQDGKRPDSITVQLYAGTVLKDSKTVAAKDGWSYQFENLPEYANGQKITYTVKEVSVAGYTSSVNGYNLTNTHAVEKTSIKVSKTWDDANNQDGIRPASVEIELLADNVATGNTITLNSANNWSAAFTDLAVYKSGTAISYSVRENNVKSGYTAAVVKNADGSYTVTNTHTPETTSVTITKNWSDSSNQDGKRPQNIKVHLLANGTEVNEYTIAGNDSTKDKWIYNIAGLPKYANGTQIVYTVTEDAVTDYTTSISGTTITNTHTAEKINVTGTKTWDDGNDQDGKRPASITVNLLADGTKVDSKIVTAKDNWQYSFTNLDKYKNGKAIVYTVTEEPVSDYTATIDGYNVKNSHTPEKTSVSGTKTWDDNKDQDGKRPASITINLLADGTKVDSKSVTAADNWTYSFTDLAKYKNGKAIVYTITEEPVSDYTATIDGYNIKNSHTPEKIDVSGTKTWDDNNDQDGKRPTSITVNLLADGTKVDSKTVTATDNWQYSFTNLDKYKDGKAIAYTITEDAVTGYSTTYNGYNIKNSYTPSKTAVSGTKTWDDNDNQDGKRPTSITVNLLADGTKVDSKTVTAADNWQYSFTNLDEFKGGKKIVYTVTEDDIKEGNTKIYTATIDGYNIKNSHTPEKIDVSGTKTWEDNNNQDGKRPTSITVNLLADGTKVDSKTVTATDNWQYSFTNLDKYKNGQQIVYAVTEDDIKEGDTTIYTATVDGYNIKNSHTPEKIDVSGTKTWEDNNNQDGKRPASITVNLLADGTKVDSKNVTADANGDWTYSFTNLDKYKDGKAIVYTITENAVTGYTTTYDGYNITNKHDTETTFVKVEATWSDVEDLDAKRPALVKINLLADGEPVRSQQEVKADANGVWNHEFKDLPVYKTVTDENGVTTGGHKIVYTVTEENITDYTIKVDGPQPVARTTGYSVAIENTHNPDKTEVKVSKTWNHGANPAASQPTSVVIELLADGTPTGQMVTLSASDDASKNWADAFKDLNVYKHETDEKGVKTGGHPITYTIRETAVTNYSAQVSGSAADGYTVTNTYTPPQPPVNPDPQPTPGGNDDGGNDGGNSTPSTPIQSITEFGSMITDGIQNLIEYGSFTEPETITEDGAVGGATGDDSDMVVYGATAGVSAAILALWFALRRRRQNY